MVLTNQFDINLVRATYICFNVAYISHHTTSSSLT